MGGASLLGGVMSNSASARSAREQMAFQAGQAGIARTFEHGEAQINRDWQRDMSNTAHQREIRDLASAGLNPILSATGGGGASTPGGATAHTSAPSGAKYEASDVVTPAVSSALAARRNLAEVKNMEATNDNIKQDTRWKLEQTRGAHEDIYRKYWETARTENENLSEIERLGMLRDQRPGSRTEYDIDRSMYGQGIRYVDRIGKYFGSALGAARLGQQSRHNRYIRDGN